MSDYTKFNENLQLLVDHIQGLQNSFGSIEKKIVAERSGRWIKILICQYDGENLIGRTIHSFVAADTFSNKVLGEVKIGDIMKPASFKTPARHARGNIFGTNQGRECCDRFGVAYIC